MNSNGWDTHQNIVNLKERYPGDRNAHLPSLDRALSALISDLSDRGMLDETLVVVMGEFGRTPKINSRRWSRPLAECLQRRPCGSRNSRRAGNRQQRRIGRASQGQSGHSVRSGSDHLYSAWHRPRLRIAHQRRASSSRGARRRESRSRDHRLVDVEQPTPPQRWCSLTNQCACVAIGILLIALAPNANAFEPPIADLTFSPSGESVVAVSQTGTHVYSWPKLERQKTFASASANLHCVTFAPGRKEVRHRGWQSVRGRNRRDLFVAIR